MSRSGRVTECSFYVAACVFAYVGFVESSDEQGLAFHVIPHEAGTLRVVTWNVGGRDAEPLRDEWIPGVADTIALLNADLVFLQELVDEEQFDRLRAAVRDATPSQPMFGTVSPGSGRRVGVLFQRGALRARPIARQSSRAGLAIRYHADGVPGQPTLVAVALHADAFSSEKRNRQIGRAVDRLMSAHFMCRCRSPDGPCPRSANVRMLAGDLNLDMDLDKRRDLFSDNEHRDVESYNYIAAHLFDAAAGSGSTADPDRRLDYIFADRHVSVIRGGPWKNRRTGSMDHDPLVADLRYRP